MTNCECPAAGYCQRHKVTKGSGWHKLCQTKQTYFDAWESGSGPGQKTPVDAKRVREKKCTDKAREQKNRLIDWLKWLRIDSDKGLGDTIERQLAKMGGRKIKHLIESLGGNCGCTNRQAWLNKKYPY